MNVVEAFKIAFRSLRANKLRSSLTALGIIVGVAAVVCMVAVGAGAGAEVSEKIRTLGANLLLIRPGAQSSGAARLESGTRPTLTEDDASAIRRDLHDVQVAAPLLSRPLQVVAGNRNWATLVAGINPDYLLGREWVLKSGRPFASSELSSSAKVAIIGADLAAQLFDGRVRIGESVRIANAPFTVIGVLGEKGQGAAGRSQDDVVFIPLSTAKSRVLGAINGTRRDALDFILIKVSDAAAIPDVKKQLEALLRQRHHIRKDAADDFTVENPADILTAREGAVRTLSLLLIAVASVSLLVGGISIMNIMIVSVTERTREIGLRIAVGARRRDILRQFLIEAFALALASGIAGTLLGAAAAIAIALKTGWPVLISPSSIVVACGFAGFVGIVFGLYPAHKAAQLDPIEALRFE